MIEPHNGFILVHVSTPIKICERRDRKKLYAKTRAKIVKEFTKISDPYKKPQNANLAIDTTERTAEKCVQTILLHLERRATSGPRRAGGGLMDLGNPARGGRPLARRAGEAIEAVRPGSLEAEEKADGSPVTAADRAAEAILVDGLRPLLPGVVVVSEEGDVETAIAGAGSTYWLVDPLDGTKEFLKGLPEYTVNVALVEAAVPILGVIYVSASDCLAWPLAGRERVAGTHVGTRTPEGAPSHNPGGPSCPARTCLPRRAPCWSASGSPTRSRAAAR
jgi:hypothetical protein